MDKRISDKVKGIKNSIEKWEEVKKRIIKKDKRIGYKKKYWITCGYCNVFVDCEDCPLFKGSVKYDGTLYCRCDGQYFSVARNSLALADMSEWEEALEYVNILLSKMKRDLAAYGRFNDRIINRGA